MPLYEIWASSLVYNPFKSLVWWLLVKRHFRVLLWSKPCTLTWSWDQAECTVCKSMILNEKSVTSYLICTYYTILPIRYKILAVYAPVLTSTNKNDTLIYTVFTMSCGISLSPTFTVSIHSNTSWLQNTYLPGSQRMTTRQVTRTQQGRTGGT